MEHLKLQGERVLISRCMVCANVYGCEELKSKPRRCKQCDKKFQCYFMAVVELEAVAKEFRQCETCPERDSCGHYGKKRSCVNCTRRSVCRDAFLVDVEGIKWEISHGFCSARCMLDVHGKFFSTKEMLPILEHDGVSQEKIEMVMETLGLLEKLGSLEEMKHMSRRHLDDAKKILLRAILSKDD